MKIAHILYTTDLSDDSFAPCVEVQELAKSLGARLTVLHVLQKTVVPVTGHVTYPPVTPPETLFAEAEASLEKRRVLFEKDLDVSFVTIWGDEIGEDVVEYAEKHDVDLLALCTHGRTGFKRLVIGSAAEQILRHATLPVLCFRKPK